jgi:hypothetical protein
MNRLYVFCFSVLLVAPASTRGEDGIDRHPAWPVRVLQLTLVLHYFAAGMCKMSPGDWLKANDVLQSQVQGFYMTDLAAWMIRSFPSVAWTAMQHLSLAFELAAPLLFGVRRLRWVGIVWGAALHILVALAMYKLIYFTLQMLCFYLLFIEPSLLHRVRATVATVVRPRRALPGRGHSGAPA